MQPQFENVRAGIGVVAGQTGRVRVRLGVGGGPGLAGRDVVTFQVKDCQTCDDSIGAPHVQFVTGAQHGKEMTRMAPPHRFALCGRESVGNEQPHEVVEFVAFRLVVELDGVEDGQVAERGPGGRHGLRVLFGTRGVRHVAPDGAGGQGLKIVGEHSERMPPGGQAARAAGLRSSPLTRAASARLNRLCRRPAS